ncbi:MAG: hypothetical protein ABSG59_19265 [Verrucomicrobiota bacterium]|jgi:hypothetical protein
MADDGRAGQEYFRSMAVEWRGDSAAGFLAEMLCGHGPGAEDISK